MTDFAQSRERMVASKIQARGIDNAALLEAMRAVPRERFVPPGHAAQAYADTALPIEAGQTISQPYIVALMIDAAGIGPKDRILEVGAGSGYAAAVIGLIAADVIAIERQSELARSASERIASLGYRNVRIIEGDGTLGWPAGAPYDAILVAASGKGLPQPLIDQLKSGGRLVMPVGGQLWSQELIKVTKQGDGSIVREHLASVRFVPLVEP
jgi:protein-L-isoaspartate(D-aspartate) O-methyltransferase